MTVIAYTDASYDDELDIATCGMLVLVDGKEVKHEIVFVEGFGTVAKAEVFAVTKALQYCFLIQGVTKIEIHSDWRPFVFGYKRKKTHSHNKEFNETLEIVREHGINFSLHYVKAHSNDKYNTKIDLSCNRMLRKYIQDNKIKAA